MTAVVEQIYTGCLAQACYFIVSDGEAAVIDPLRDPAPYVELAAKHNAKIKYIIETHFHADFVSGHVDLSRACGGTIVFGPTAEPNYDAFIAKDGEELPLGKTKITVLHTPGHTMESTSFLLHKEDGSPHGVFTGDTLFIGDAGRPDLAQKAANLTQEQLAGHLFRSLRNKIMVLPDETIIWPGHGAGSACGKNMSKETTDTLGNQKRTNYTLRADMTEAEFTKELLDGLRPPPGYFGSQVAMNKGHVAADVEFSDVLNKGLTKLSVDDVKAKLAAGVTVFDARRSPEDFCAQHVPGTIFAGTSGSLAVWVATVFSDVHQPYVMIAEPDVLIEGITRLARVGFNNPIGHLDGGVEAWKAAGNEVATLESWTPAKVGAMLAEKPDEVQILDVRGPGEFRNDHLDMAMSTPLCSREPLDFNAIVQDGKMAFAHCAGGYRSVMFLSLCKRAGKHNVANIEGGWDKMMKDDSLHQHAVSRKEQHVK